MNGIVVFRSIADAIKAGYEILGPSEDGYYARIIRNYRYALARVVVRK